VHHLDGGMMTNDERKLLEDRIYQYGSAVLLGDKAESAEWNRLMDDLTKIQKREESDVGAKADGVKL